MDEAVTDTEQTMELVRYDADAERWAPIATWAEAEPEKALDEFTLAAIRILTNKPRNMAYWLQRALGQFDKRVGIASLALREAEKHKPTDGWREPATSIIDTTEEA